MRPRHSRQEAFRARDRTVARHEREQRRHAKNVDTAERALLEAQASNDPAAVRRAHLRLTEARRAAGRRALINNRATQTAYARAARTANRRTC